MHDKLRYLLKQPGTTPDDIIRAFEEAGYMKLDRLKLDVYNAMENLEVALRTEHKCMNGQEWYDKFGLELGKLSNGTTETVKPEVIKAAKKAASIE